MPAWRWREQNRTRACAGSSLAVLPRRGLSLARARTKMRAFVLVVVGARDVYVMLLHACRRVDSAAWCQGECCAAAASVWRRSARRVRGAALRPSRRCTIGAVPVQIGELDLVQKRFASGCGVPASCSQKAWEPQPAFDSVQNASPVAARASNNLEAYDTCAIARTSHRRRLLHDSCGMRAPEFCVQHSQQQ